MTSKLKQTATVFGILFTFAITFFFDSTFVEAKVPEVGWAEELLLVSDDTNELLVTRNNEQLKGYKKKITDALTKKLLAARDAGKLPFTLDTGKDSYEQPGFLDESPEQYIALIPLAIMADSLQSKYEANGKTYYKSVVFGSIYLSICKAGSTPNNWTMIGGIPISGYTILGGNINNPLTEKPTKKDEADAYIRTMEKVINEQLDFSKLDRYLKNLKNNKMPDTYEVMEVNFSSKKSAEIFENEQEKIKAMLGNFFSSKFQETSKAVVYPPIAMIAKNTGGDMTNAIDKSKADDVNDAIYALSGGKSAGVSMTLSMPKPDHKIYLDFAGAAWQELQTKKESDVVKNMGYKALLKMHVDNQAEKSADDVKSVQYLIPSSGSIEALHKERLADIFTELLIRLSDKLATGKK